MHPISEKRGLFLGAGLLALQLGYAPTATALDPVSASPDITVELDQSGGGTFDDHDVAIDDLAGTTLPANLGSLADADEVTAYELLPGGHQLVCFETTTVLSATLSAQPADVARFDGTAYSLEFDASANGVPDGVACDAVAVDGAGNLLLSFDTAVLLVDAGGTSFVAHDEDLVRVDAPMAFSLYFDGSAVGVPDRADVDGAHVPATGGIMVSFDVSGKVPGVGFDDEDVLAYDPGPASWSLVLDLSTRDSDWIAADADAISVPEPAALLVLSAGSALLAAAGRRRTRRS